MIFDIEADALLLKDVTKIHCLAYTDGKEICVTSDYDVMRKVLLEAPVVIGHNIILYDLPVVKKILGIDVKAQLIDTLALSWYLNHTRTLHGLEAYGVTYGVPKPEVTDWVNLSVEVYQHRCKEDVKINRHLWHDLRDKLLRLYGDKKEADRFLRYLSFKMECVQEQHRSRWKLDKELAKTTLEKLLAAQTEKIDELVKVMPKVEKVAYKTRPKKPYNKAGGLTVLGREWDSFLKRRGLESDHSEPVPYVAKIEEPNPNSTDQVKDWLFSLGWEPATFKYVKDGDGERSIPQLRVDGEEGKELCPSIKLMFDKYPFLELLEGLSVIQHRISILNGFLENEVDGYLIADIGGLTNTLRLKHRVLVNLPGVYKPWGKEIRGCLIADDGYILCGSDMTSLEDSTKKHYMYPYDPKYVEEMSSSTFDPHLDLAKFAKVVTQDEIDFYVGFKKASKAEGFLPTILDKELYRKVDIFRKTYKVANYACVYGVGGPKLARSTGLKLKEAKELIDVYWKRNWSIKKFSEDATVKELGSEMWVFNPVSKFWYSLRKKKDIFSTVNQSTGVYCFDQWIYAFRKMHPQLTGQFHDEIIKQIKEGAEEKCRKVLLDAINLVNEKLKLNVTLRVDIQFGKTYADIH